MKLSGDKLTVFDEKTGLTWQQSGSNRQMSYTDAENYVADLNMKKFAGYNNWRLPTRDEAMSILLLQPVNNFYADPLFDKTQWWIWTADKASEGRAWYVLFINGGCDHYNFVGSYYVRAVHS